MASASDTLSYSEPGYTRSVDRAKFPFYLPNIDAKLIPEVRNNALGCPEIGGDGLSMS